jgi:hypothetical protein
VEYSVKPEKNRIAFLLRYTIKLLTKLFGVATLRMINFINGLYAHNLMSIASRKI